MNEKIIYVEKLINDLESSGGPDGLVLSVNGQKGVVDLHASDIPEEGDGTVQQAINNIRGVTGATVSSPTAPSNPSPNQRWFNTSDGRTYVFYRDRDSSQWVEENPSNINSDMVSFIGFTTPEQFGVGASSFEEAAAYAKTKGWFVKLDGVEYNLERNADMQFVPVKGNGQTTVVGVGALVNTKSIEGVILSGKNVSEEIQGVIPALEKSGSIVVQYADDSFYVLTKNSARKEYVAIRMRSGKADGDAPWDLIREQSAFSCELALAYENIGSASFAGSSWEDYNFTSSTLGFPTGTTSGTENAYCVGKKVTAVGDYVDITPSTDDDGNFSLSFLLTKGSAGVADIYLDKGTGLPTVNSDGTTSQTPEYTIYTKTSKNKIRKVKLNSSLEVVKVRVVSRSNNPTYLMGANVDTPETSNPIFKYDKWAYYRKPTHQAYVANTGASDYAMRDLDKGSLVGSFHGSESKVENPKWSLDGVTPVFVTDKPFVAKEVKLYQHTLINGKVTSKSEHSFGDGWVQKFIDLSGNMRSDSVYLGMCLPQVINTTENVDCFTELLYPFNLNVKPVGEYPLGGCNLVVWRNPVTEARVYAYHRNFGGWNAKTSPAYIKTAYGTTTYSKLYHNLQKDSENLFTGASSQIIHLYA